jgi:2-isopropylmalate synthase
LTEKVYIYDTTLRDGAQAEGISFSLEDKIKIAIKLDEMGVDYIEGGIPASNPKDMEFFRLAAEMPWQTAKPVAFGFTCRHGRQAESDPQLQDLLNCGAAVLAIVGKSWDFQVSKALSTTLQENLRMITDSISFLKAQGREVFFDAEHFFDGFKRNPEYAKKVVLAAESAEADGIVLCDTNGGSLPHEIHRIVSEIVGLGVTRLGIHAHNDSDLAVANSLAAIEAGAIQVQGTANGYGERCGNTNLFSVIPNLELKMGKRCLPPGNLSMLTGVSHYVAEVANVAHRNDFPFVGHSAFAHKGGIHVSAILKDVSTYEHIRPEAVGNQRTVLISEVSGMSSLLYKAQEFGLELSKETEEGRKAIARIKKLEHEGYQFEDADASLELLLRRALGHTEEMFELETFRIITERKSDESFTDETVIKAKMGDTVVHTAAEGVGPVNAVDNALRKALSVKYPFLKGLHLKDYKVRVLNETAGTKAKVRVLIETTDGHNSWNTVGVSENIIEASWQALVDSFSYALLLQDKCEGMQPA